jgi:UDP-N-acetylmuramoyl-tripeptide--D-alanyl-D-alanine ligase
MQIDELYRLFTQYPKIITDTRADAAGGIFFALKGNHFDGNRFAAEALAGGAAYAVVDDPEVAINDRYIPVPNVLTALQDLAKTHRRQFNIPVIALTGTNGKTTSKELIRCVLASQYETLATTGNLNNHIGVPLSLLHIRPQTEIAVIEMGANHCGEIKTLCDIALPTHGLITNIGKAHLEGFGGAEGVKQAKKELYDHIANHQGTIFYHEENPVLTALLSGAQATLVPYGDACKGNVLSASPYLQVHLNISGVDYEVRTQMAGAYNLENVLAAVCVGAFFGITAKQIVTALSEYQPQNSRSQIIQTANNRLLLDYYNANPTSMKASLQNFIERIAGNKMVILGDMFELGDASLAEHCAIVELLAAHPDIIAIVVGKYFAQAAKTHSGILAFEEVDALKTWLAQHPPQGKSILVKASRSMKLEQIPAFL